MSAPKIGRSASDSWTAMTPAVYDGLTETTTAGVELPCETHDARASVPPTQTRSFDAEAAIGEDTTEAMREVDKVSEASEDSWVEVTEAELLAQQEGDELAVDGEAGSSAAAAVETETVATPPTASEEVKESEAAHAATESNTQEQHEDAPREASVERAGVAAEIESEATTPAQSAMAPTTEAEAAATTAGVPQKMNLAEFLAGLALTKAYEATGGDKTLSEHEAAAQVLASFDQVDSSDDFTALAAEDREGEETIDLDVLPSSVSPQRRPNEQNSAAATSRHSTRPTAVVPHSTGVTAVLRRRMVAEDWMRTLRGPSPLSPEERVEVFQALFGDTVNAPITAERFKEMMVPFERHCDCLGASYGFHHQGCRYNTESQLTS